MSSVVEQAMRLHANEGWTGTLKRLPRMKKVLDYHTGRLLVPIEQTIWGAYRVPAEGWRNSSIPNNYLPPRGENAVHGIYGGTWDSYAEPLKQTPFYQSMVLRFEEGVPWEETPYFQMSKKRLNRSNGTVWNGCATLEDLHERANQVDELFSKIEKEGYVAQTNNGGTVGKYQIPNEVVAAIGRNGNLIRLAGGRHRITIANILGLEIRAVITLCHRHYIHDHSGFTAPV